jgi:hypothetical protein
MKRNKTSNRVYFVSGIGEKGNSKFARYLSTLLNRSSNLEQQAHQTKNRKTKKAILNDKISLAFYSEPKQKYKFLKLLLLDNPT